MVGDAVSCEVCKYAVGYLDNVLTTNSTEEEIKKEVEALCSHLPAAIENEVRFRKCYSQIFDELVYPDIPRFVPPHRVYRTSSGMGY